MNSTHKRSPAAATSRAAQASTNQHSHYSDIGRARNALNAITPDVDRDEWIKIGMGAKAAGLDFDDFDAWSAGGQTYRQADARSAWRSFKIDRGIGAGTLFWIAGEHGWREHIRPYHKRPSRVGPRWDYRGLLRSLRFESMVVIVAANDIVNGNEITQADKDRLTKAAIRIARVAEVAK